jgi:hypothetical protein
LQLEEGANAHPNSDHPLSPRGRRAQTISEGAASCTQEGEAANFRSDTADAKTPPTRIGDGEIDPGCAKNYRELYNGQRGNGHANGANGHNYTRLLNQYNYAQRPARQSSVCQFPNPKRRSTKPNPN